MAPAAGQHPVLITPSTTWPGTASCRWQVGHSWVVPASLWAPWHGVGLSGPLPSSRLRPHNEQHSRNQSACQVLEIADDIAVLQRDGTRRRCRDPCERRFTVGVGSHVVVEAEKSQDLPSTVWTPRRGPGSGGPGALVSPRYPSSSRGHIRPLPFCSIQALNRWASPPALGRVVFIQFPCCFSLETPSQTHQEIMSHSHQSK